MLSKKSMAFLERLMSCSSPSGFETESAGVFSEYLSSFADRVYMDVMGNCFGTLNEKAKIKVMLAGHYDEIGFQVTYISKEGFVHIREVGGIDMLTVPGSKVDIMTAKGKVPGVIGKKPIHQIKRDERGKVPEIKELWIDIGVDCKEDAVKMVSVGDPVAVRPNYERLGKNLICSKGIDDKIGAFVVAETMRELSKGKLNVAVYGVGTVQEELGLRGSGPGAFGINPQAAFAIDVGLGTDMPGIEKKQWGEVNLGDGASLTHSADVNPVLLRKVKSSGDKRKVKYQNCAGYRATGGTDAARIQLNRTGVATALVSIPCRYMHTPVEVCDLRDVESAIKLISATIADFAADESFVPQI